MIFIKVDFLKYQPKKLIFKEEISPIIKKNPFKFVDGLIRFKKLRTWKKKNILSKPDYIKCENSFSKNVSIYGSDEIWNFSNPFFGYDDFFFGKYDNSYKISSREFEKFIFSMVSTVRPLLEQFFLA